MAQLQDDRDNPDVSKTRLPSPINDSSYPSLPGTPSAAKATENLPPPPPTDTFTMVNATGSLSGRK